MSDAKRKYWPGQFHRRDKSLLQGHVTCHQCGAGYGYQVEERFGTGDEDVRMEAIESRGWTYEMIDCCEVWSCERCSR